MKMHRIKVHAAAGRRIITVLSAVMMAMSLLAGCGNAVQNDLTDKQTEETAAADVTAGAAKSADNDEKVQAIPEEELTMPESAVSSAVWEVAGRTYVFSRYKVISYDEASGKSKVLWEKDEDDGSDRDADMYAFSGGSGLILKDRIYYLDSESINEDDMWTETIRLYSMALDGTDIRELFKKEGLSGTYGRDMAYADGILYIYYQTAEPPLCLVMDDKGEVSKSVDYSALDTYEYYEDGYSVPSQSNNGCTLVFPAITRKELHRLITCRDYSDLVITNTDNGDTSEYVGQSVVAMSGSKILMYHYNSTTGNCEYSVLDAVTEEYNKILSAEESILVFAMDDKYAYIYGDMMNVTTDDEQYYKIDLSNGEKSLLYTVDSNDRAIPGYALNTVDASYKDGMLYCGVNTDYALSYARIDTASDNTTIILDKFYDTGISEIGTLVGKSSKTSYDGKVMATASANVIHLDKRFAGADSINEVMDGIMDTTISFVEDNREDCIEWYKESGGEYFIPYSCDCNFRYVSYNDGKLINVMLEGYDYYGGAHGMPYWHSLVFDLETGEQKTMADLFDITEEELDEIAVEAAGEHMTEIGEYYWDGYEDTVREYTNLETGEYYLTDDGVVLYYAPYVLASYAAGFQEFAIPYDKLKPNFR